MAALVARRQSEHVVDGDTRLCDLLARTSVLWIVGRIIGIPREYLEIVSLDKPL